MYIHIHTYNGIPFIHKKDEILPFGTTCIDLEIFMLSEINQKKLRTIRFHSYMEYKTESNK